MYFKKCVRKYRGPQPFVEIKDLTKFLFFFFFLIKGPFPLLYMREKLTLPIVTNIWVFIPFPFIHTFNKFLSSAYYALDTWVIAVYKTGVVPLLRLYILVGKANIKQGTT